MGYMGCVGCGLHGLWALGCGLHGLWSVGHGQWLVWSPSPNGVFLALSSLCILRPFIAPGAVVYYRYHNFTGHIPNPGFKGNCMLFGAGKEAYAQVDPRLAEKAARPGGRCKGTARR